MKKKLLSLLTVAIVLAGIFASFIAHEAKAETVLTKGGAVVLLDWSRRGSATNIANFTYSAVLRVVSPDGTNQFGITSNCVPFIVNGGVSNALGFSGSITNGTGTGKIRVWKGLVIGIE